MNMILILYIEKYVNSSLLYSGYYGGIGALEGAVDMILYPGAEIALDSKIDFLRSDINDYWNGYETSINEVITHYSNLRDTSFMLHDYYLNNSIVEYAETRKGDRWRY